MSCLFPQASTYPSFFDNNLSDPHRVIKLLQGKKSHIRAYYYQIFKLVFQLEVQKDGIELDYQRILINVFTKTAKLATNQQKIQNYVTAIEKFIQEVSSKQLIFQEFLEQNKQIDQALIAIFQQILKQADLNGCTVLQTFTYLSELFDQKITTVEKCVKFEQSDVFIYIQNQTALYLVFLKLISQDQQQNSAEKSIQKAIPVEQTKIKKSIHHNDTIINIIGDMMQSSKHDSFHTNHNLTISQSPFKSEQKVYNENEKIAEEDKKKQLKLERNFLKDESKVESYNLNLKKDEHQIMYRPKNSLQSISEMGMSKQSTLYQKNRKRDPMNLLDQRQKGTFYRQFTDTRILNILPEPQRTNVRILKNRFAGVHTRQTITKF